MEPKILTKPIDQQPLNEVQLIQQVGQWSDKNFRDLRGAEWGVGEEIGEACHCILKHRQKIRGFDKEEYFLEQFTDSLADTMIYLADWCYLRNTFFKLGRNQMVAPVHADERTVIIHLLQGAAQMFNFPEVFPGDIIPPAHEGPYNMIAQRICNGVECWAKIYDIDLRMAIASTWAKVGQRDWKKNPSAPESDQV